MCLKLFNCLSCNTKCVVSKKMFRIKVKHVLINLEPNSIRDYIGR